MEIKELIVALCDICVEEGCKPSWFNLGLHEGSLEIYTAEEHDDWRYIGGIGRECCNSEEIRKLLLEVKAEYEYNKPKDLR